MSGPGQPRRASRSTRLSVLLLESLKLLGIAVGCLVVLAIAFFLSVKTGIVIPGRWIGFCFWTAILIWFLCQRFKRRPTTAKFWIGLLSLLLIHLMAFIVLLQRYPDWRAARFMLIFIIEAPCAALVLETFVSDKL